ncbi:MAG TPA: sigma-54 dependent transcriptional regulator [Thermodesulfobacteriota bacterium]|nr:sigma-54 dependent transcriptional regulator [Thermodesulfobacteriota bacterium]
MNKRPILIVEDEPEWGKLLVETLSRSGYSVHLAENAEKAMHVFHKGPVDLVVADVRLPGMNGIQLLDNLKSRSAATPVILMTGFGTVTNAVEAMKKGAFDYLLKPFSLKILEEGVERALGNHPQPEAAKPPAPGSIITQDRKVKEILLSCGKVARSKATVLIQGESGTGKELLARYIHENSPRKDGPFVAVNCASLPETLLESELFGHEKGAFTGAVARKIGKFELASGGTILLDEISEMNTFLQAKILRVLQENEVDRIGGSRPIAVDIRVVATTNRDLEAYVKKGGFREDLYYRLNVINVVLPPLRERPGDVDLLTGHFLKTFAAEHGKEVSLSPGALDWLRKREWRGNIRELKNVLERAVLLSGGPVLEEEDFAAPEEVAPGPRAAGAEESSLCLREVEERVIARALEKTGGNRTHAAKILGISIRTLRNKLNEYKEAVRSGPGT